ncbi:MAG: hypothetical protein AABW67_02375 [Nanoarchaeota archaeon]
MNKSLVLGLLIFVSALSMISAVQYGMMDDNGQFTPTNSYGSMMGGMMYGIGGGFGSGMMLLSWITYLAILTLIIAGIYWLIKSANRRK